MILQDVKRVEVVLKAPFTDVKLCLGNLDLCLCGELLAATGRGNSM